MKLPATDHQPLTTSRSPVDDIENVVAAETQHRCASTRSAPALFISASAVSVWKKRFSSTYGAGQTRGAMAADGPLRDRFWRCCVTAAAIPSRIALPRRLR